MNVINLLFGFQGRIGRAQYWIVVAVWVGATLALVLLMAVLTMMLDIEPPASVFYTLVLLIYIPMIVSAVAAGIKRLHDRNKTAWWLLVFYLLPLALPWLGLLLTGGFGADIDTLPLPVIVLYYVRVAIGIWALIELGCVRGSIGGNPYGPDPVAPRPAKH